MDNLQRLQRHLDRIEKDYSATMSEVLTDLHYLKSKINKDSQLDYEQKQNDIECKKVENLKEISSKDFSFRLILTSLVVFGGLSLVTCLVKYLFF